MADLHDVIGSAVVWAYDGQRFWHLRESLYKLAMRGGMLVGGGRGGGAGEATLDDGCLECSCAIAGIEHVRPCGAQEALEAAVEEELGGESADLVAVDEGAFVGEDLYAAVFPMGRAGDYMVSFRNLNMVAVIDKDTKRIKWALTGNFVRQHDPDILPNGNILLFDNLGGMLKRDRPQGRTRIIEIDSATHQIVWKYEGGTDPFDVLDAPLPDEDTPVPVRFLPQYDNVFLAHADRSRINVEDGIDHKPLFTVNGWWASVWIDGFIQGAWKLKRERSTATLRIRLFESVTKRARVAVAEEGEGLLKFLAADAETRELQFVES